MNDNVDNLVIEHLKALRNEIKDFRTHYESDTADIKHRLTAVERGIASIKHDNATSYDEQIRQQVSMDKIVERINLIERRLEITSA
jgi:hypothetical protein